MEKLLETKYGYPLKDTQNEKVLAWMKPMPL